MVFWSSNARQFIFLPISGLFRSSKRPPFHNGTVFGAESSQFFFSLFIGLVLEFQLTCHSFYFPFLKLSFPYIYPRIFLLFFIYLLESFFKFSMSSTTPQKRRRKRPYHRARDRQRMVEYHHRCVVCYALERPQYHSTRLPCCDQFIHECCLINSVKHGPRGYSESSPRCPHCRSRIFIVDPEMDTDWPPWNPQTLPCFYLLHERFNYIHMRAQYLQGLYSCTYSETDDLFLNPPSTYQRPPGFPHP